MQLPASLRSRSGQAHRVLTLRRVSLGFLASLLIAASAETQSRINIVDEQSPENQNTALVERLLRSGIFRVAGQKGIKVVDDLVARGFLRVGAISGTNGRVFELDTAVPRQCLRPNNLLICTWGRNLGCEINEWLVYHLWTVGVNHVVFYDDHSSDNTRAVLKPWSDAGLVTVRESNRTVPSLSHWTSYNACFKDFGSHYTWTAFIDIDEFIMPLSKPCLPDLLDAYSAHGGLTVGFSYTASPYLFARRNRMTIFEATNYTLGYSHELVKSICYSNRTAGPAYRMTHCCEYREGYTPVDETFAFDPSSPCWLIPYGNGLKPRVHITLVHSQASSFEERIQRRIRKTELPTIHNFSAEFTEGVNITSAWRQFVEANQLVAQKGVQPNAAVLKRMKDFRHVLNKVLVGRDKIDARYHSSMTLNEGYAKAVDVITKLATEWPST